MPLLASILQAVHAYLDDNNYTKTARRLLKEADSLADAPRPDFSLTPLFRRLEQELPKPADVKRSLYTYLKGQKLKKTAKSLAKECGMSRSELKEPTVDISGVFSRLAQAYQGELDLEEQRRRIRDWQPVLSMEGADDTAEGPPSNKRRRRNAKPLPTQPLQRLDVNEWEKHVRIKNDFWSKGGDSFGAQAAQEMIRVKGRGFRTEKQKKKRAAWQGRGEIDMGVNSITFNDSD